MICPGCTARLPDDSRFCPQCGQPTPLALLNEKTLSLSAVPNSEFHDNTEVSALVSAENGSSESISLDADALHTCLTQANLCRIRREWSQAIDHCVVILRAQPGNQTAHALLGDIYRDQGNLDDAIQWYRMAVDLDPKPADMAKLKSLETERGRMIQTNYRRAGIGAMALNADGSPTMGTTNLMGLPPLRWLRTFWIVSLSFVLLTVFFLIGIQKKRNTTTPAPTNTFGAATNSTFGTVPTTNPSNNADVLPPPRPGGTGSFSSPTPQPYMAGSGLPPDTSGPGAFASRNGTNNSVQPMPVSPPQNVPESAANLPPAPVIGIPPYDPNAAQRTPRQDGLAVTSGSDIPPVAVQNTTLPGGLHVLEAQGDPTSGKVSLVLSSSLVPSALDNRTRLMVLRDMAHAANQVFSRDRKAQSITMKVQSTQGSLVSGSTLVTAEIDRTTSRALSPETASYEMLDERLQPHWTNTSTSASLSSPQN